MWALVNTFFASVVSEETYPTREAAEAALATSEYRGDPNFKVAEVAYCSSCGQKAGLIPVYMLDGFGCQRLNCNY